MDITSEALSLVEKIKQRFNAGAFNNFIKYIRFPYFKNLEYDSEINFNFPLTVFVGENGAGKSSTLQALYGAPRGKSPGDFGFLLVLILLRNLERMGKTGILLFTVL